MENGVPVSQTISFYAQWTSNDPDPNGIDMADMPNISVYPNPTANLVTVSGAEVQRIEVIGLDGRRCLTEEGTNTIALGILPNGVYMLRIDTKNSTTLRRIVKQ